MTVPVRAFIGLGSNQADPPRQLDAALEAIGRLPGTRLVAVSPRYVTAPFGPVPQPDFLNAVAEVETALAPQPLLDALHGIEAAQRRVRTIRWGPRTLDLDLLLHGDARIETPSLVLPHPGIVQRNFVLYPLRDIAPALEIQGLGGVSELAARVSGEGIRRSETAEVDSSR
jgi:2-amino-4-hydroxy-6-hydroxymethyldihydropteridine diphosphokinase